MFVEDVESRSLLNAAPKKINMGEIGGVPIPFPSAEEQTSIAAILSDMDAEIAALESKLAKSRQIKQGMMHNLLTGRIRLV
ncbi:MAG: restriction endonuclease subunit S [Rhodomicrobium sp.]